MALNAFYLIDTWKVIITLKELFHLITKVNSNGQLATIEHGLIANSWNKKFIQAFYVTLTIL